MARIYVNFLINIIKTPIESGFQGVLCREEGLTKKHGGANMNNCTNIALLPVSGSQAAVQGALSRRTPLLYDGWRENARENYPKFYDAVSGSPAGF